MASIIPLCPQRKHRITECVPLKITLALNERTCRRLLFSGTPRVRICSDVACYIANGSEVGFGNYGYQYWQQLALFYKSFWKISCLESFFRFYFWIVQLIFCINSIVTDFFYWPSQISVQPIVLSYMTINSASTFCPSTTSAKTYSIRFPFRPLPTRQCYRQFIASAYTFRNRKKNTHTPIRNEIPPGPNNRKDVFRNNAPHFTLNPLVHHALTHTPSEILLFRSCPAL